MHHRLSRRQVVQGAGAVGLGLLAGCGRLPGQAQQPAKVPRIGLLSGGSVGAPIYQQAFRHGLRDLGYVEGQNVLIESRSAQATPERYFERYPEIAAELVRLPVDLIVTSSNSMTRAAKDATSAIPIVFAWAGVDPVAAGLVTSLARPGGNVTGLSGVTTILSGKRLELLKEAVPTISRVGIIWESPSADKAIEFRETQAAAQVLRVQLIPLELRSPGEFEGVLETAIRERADALIPLSSALTGALAPAIVQFALRHRLPTMFEFSETVTEGGLIAYGPDRADMHRRAATYVDKILKGAKPADLPVEQPMRFELAINLTTAQALGLIIPPHVLLQATEVIQ
jgi:putative tryptophan/tyrosine transport system substrate-binding protein